MFIWPKATWMYLYRFLSYPLQQREVFLHELNQSFFLQQKYLETKMQFPVNLTTLPPDDFILLYTLRVCLKEE